MTNLLWVRGHKQRYVLKDTEGEQQEKECRKDNTSEAVFKVNKWRKVILSFNDKFHLHLLADKHFYNKDLIQKIESDRIWTPSKAVEGMLIRSIIFPKYLQLAYSVVDYLYKSHSLLCFVLFFKKDSPLENNINRYYLS